MIQVETTVISESCNAWRNRLREHREKLQDSQKELQSAARRKLTREQLQEMESLHNQLHIQLINVHDLKHAIRNHLKKAGHEFDVKNGHITDDTMAEHEGLLVSYSELEERLHQLQSRFRSFVTQTN